MKWSNTTAKLDEALARAQSGMQPAVKSARGHNYSYASLNEVMDSAMDCLTNAGCSLTQGIDWIDGSMVITTRIACSGEYLITYFPISADNRKSMNAMQAMGSASTYGRRYAIQCALGIAPITEEEAARLNLSASDDDGVKSGETAQEFTVRLKEQILAYGRDTLGRHRDTLEKYNLGSPQLLNLCTNTDDLQAVLETIQRSQNGHQFGT